MAAINNHKDFDIATTSGMEVDELVTIATTSRLVPDAYYHEEELQATSPITVPHRSSRNKSKRFSDVERKYHVNPRVLGRGHEGSVRECVHRASSRHHAVKSVCKSDPSINISGVSREISLLNQMKHENIVQLVDVCEDAEYIHLVTDLCEGGELFDKIVEKSSQRCDIMNGATPCFSEDEAANIIHQILTAVSYMHKRDIVHRDIKPENILFETRENDSSIKLIDFDLARKHHHSKFSQPMSTIVGTPYYIAPEVLKRSYDRSCDLWSVGVIAYVLLCGYPPFNGGDNEEVYDEVLHGFLRFPTEDWSSASTLAKDFIRHLLERDAGKRMTAEEALDHPWITKHITKTHDDRNDDIHMVMSYYEEETRQDNNSTSVEVVFEESYHRDSILFCGGMEKCEF